MKPAIRPCAGRCGRMTRNSRKSIEDYPDTVCRERDDMCRWCWNHRDDDAVWRPKAAAVPVHSFRICKGHCGRLTRHSGILIADAPQTVIRAKDGKCQWCIDHPGEVLPPKPGRPRKAPAPVGDEVVAQARADLGAFNAARQARLAQRERASIHEQLRARRGSMTVRTA